jgi:hypothetical protein
MSQRKQIEIAIQNRLQRMVEGDSYEFIKKDEHFIKHINDNVAWVFNFYLTDKKVYSAFAMAGVRYKHLTSIIHKLLPESDKHIPFVGVSEWMAKFSDDLLSLRISSLDEVDYFAGQMYRILKETELKYLIPFSDELTAVEKFKMRPVKWPVADLMQCICHLVAYGIEHDDKELIMTGAQKGMEMKETYNSGIYKDFILALHQALVDKGYL